ncbi:MAG: RagB/SusD family nutrient uptake outer membrane protein, partial [Bacteroidota bacterium]|nr:RagB/SusD family nutrient uptake outer membrane protein [Bacteroidota bacterium]
MKKILSLLLIIFTLQACVDDLNTQPELELSLEQLLTEDPNAINGILSRLYASFALSSPSGPGSSDI